MLLLGLFNLACYASGELKCRDRGSESTTASAPTASNEKIRSWFCEYDKIRRRAKMTFIEKIQFRHLMGLALSPLAFWTSDGDDLLKKMIDRYGVAADSMEKLQFPDEVADLHNGYMRYFKEARRLFDDVFKSAKNGPATRRKLLPTFTEKKRELENLDQENKRLDARLRKQYDIPPLR
jgi:hypothetical protein